MRDSEKSLHVENQQQCQEFHTGNSKQFTVHFRLEGTSKPPRPLPWAGCSPWDQVARVLIQPGFGYLQEWGIHSSGQPMPEPHHATKINNPSVFRSCIEISREEDCLKVLKIIIIYKTERDRFCNTLEGRKSIFSNPDKKFNLLPHKTQLQLFLPV